MKRIIAPAFGALLIAWSAGFAAFLEAVPSRRADPALARLTPPDAIVVLTGPDDARLAHGFDLFAAGVAPRLLISGVFPGTDLPSLLRWGHRPGLALPAGGVTLGYRAKDTAGNAAEVRNWARANGVHRIWLVTADYHMPRALWLLHAADPDLAIVPDATVWAHGHTRSRLHYGLIGLEHRVSEYNKDLIQHALMWMGLLRLS